MGRPQYPVTCRVSTNPVLQPLPAGDRDEKSPTPCPAPNAAPPRTKAAAARARAPGRSSALTMLGAVAKLTGEELEKELSDVSTPVLLDVYAQVRCVAFPCRLPMCSLPLAHGPG